MSSMTRREKSSSMISLSERRHPAKKLYAENRKNYKPKCGPKNKLGLFAQLRLLRKRPQEGPTSTGRDRGAQEKMTVSVL
jgi:hypothetical protein